MDCSLVLICTPFCTISSTDVILVQGPAGSWDCADTGQGARGDRDGCSSCQRCSGGAAPPLPGRGPRGLHQVRRAAVVPHLRGRLVQRHDPHHPRWVLHLTISLLSVNMRLSVGKTGKQHFCFLTQYPSHNLYLKICLFISVAHTSLKSIEI